MSELGEALHSQITELCSEGDDLAGAARFAGALQKYWAAWDLLPEPKTDWAAATWILSAMGDANFLSGNFVAGRDNLSKAMQCPDALGNPFIHLRLGQCQFALENYDRAADELTRAYMGAGYEIFKNEEQKFFNFLKTRIKPPLGGWEDEPKESKWRFWKR